MGRRALTTQQFIDKARAVHGARFDYSKAEYIGAKVKVIVGCPEHGEWHVQPGNHLMGTGCPKCANQNKVAPEPKSWSEQRRAQYDKRMRIERDNKFPFGGMVALPFWPSPL